MPFIPVPHTASVQMIFTQQGQRVENVFHVRKGAEWTTIQMDDLALVFIDWWNTNIRTHLADGVKLVNVIVTSLESAVAPGIEQTGGLPIASPTTLSPLPMNVTLAVKLQTALRGRSYRGRSYLVGLPASVVTGSTVDAGYLATLRTAYGQLVSDIGDAGDGWELVIVSRVHNKEPRTEGVAVTVNGVSIDSTTDSQRRRLPGRGN